MSWSKQDEEFLFKLHLQFGNKWSFIATRMNRSQNTLKNKFYATLRKGYRKINSYIVNVKRKANPTDFINNKLIKPQFITKIAAISGENFEQRFQVKPLAIILSKRIQQGLFNLVHNDVNYGKSNLKIYNEQQNLLIQIHEFNKNCKRRKGKRKERHDSMSNQSSMIQDEQQSKKRQQQLQPQPKIVIQKLAGFNFVKPEHLINRNQQFEQIRNCMGVKRVSSLEKEELCQYRIDDATLQFPLKFQIFLDDHPCSYNQTEFARTPHSLVSNNRSFINFMNPSPVNNEYMSFKQAVQANIKRIDSNSLLNSKNYEQNICKGDMGQDKCNQMNLGENMPIMMQNYGNAMLFQSTQIKNQASQGIDLRKKYVSQFQVYDKIFQLRSKSQSVPQVTTSTKNEHSPKNDRKITSIYSQTVEKRQLISKLFQG